MKPQRVEKGFTLAEVLVVQVLMVMVSGVLFILYGQTQFIFKRGSAKIELHQKARRALVRVIPLIASANSRPEDPPMISSASIFPDGSPGPAHNLQAVLEPENPDPLLPPPVRPGIDTHTDANGNGILDIDENNQIILRSSDAYVSTLLERPPLEANFDPRDPYRWQIGHPNFGQPYPIDSGIYRIFFRRDMTKTTNTPESPGGRIGEICVDGNTPSNTGDDIVLARGVYNVQFHHVLRNTVDVVVCVKGHLPRSGGLMSDQLDPLAIGNNQASIDKLVRTTRVYLPVETN